MDYIHFLHKTRYYTVISFQKHYLFVFADVVLNEVGRNPMKCGDYAWFLLNIAWVCVYILLRLIVSNKSNHKDQVHSTNFLVWVA